MRRVETMQDSAQVASAPGGTPGAPQSSQITGMMAGRLGDEAKEQPSGLGGPGRDAGCPTPKSHPLSR